MDIILTGIARSGTTLSCALLNKLPQMVALHEPMNPAELVGLAYPDGYLERIGDFFTAQRASLMTSGHAISKARDGKVPENPFVETDDPAGLRRSSDGNQNVQFGKELNEGFGLSSNIRTSSPPRSRPCSAVTRALQWFATRWRPCSPGTRSRRL